MKHIVAIATISLLSAPHVMAEEIEAPPQVYIATPPKAWVQEDAAKSEPIPKKYAKEKAVVIKLEESKLLEEGEYVQLKLRVINPTDKPMWFCGETASNPVDRTQQWLEGEWIEEVQLICGTGLRSCVIAPGRSVVVERSFSTKELPVRIGLSYTTEYEGQGLKEFWSKKIEK